MNSFPGLTWQFNQLSTSVNFMDIMISTNTQTSIETTTFKKNSISISTFPHTLPIHLGSFQELFTAPCFEFSPFVQVMMTEKPAQGFFKHLIAHGYKSYDMKSLFHKAITHASTYISPFTDKTTEHNDVILHLPSHPNNPASYCIQDAW